MDHVERTRPGFPLAEGSSVSEWLASAQDNHLFYHRSSPQLPSEADIVIIGSGMTGSLVAKHCLDTWPSHKIVVVEARGFCSGATGRNAGHCKPDQWRGFSRFKAEFGTEQALKILRNEGDTWAAVVSYVKNNNVDCDLWVGDTLDVPVTAEAADAAKNTFEQFQAAGGNIEHIRVTHDPTEAVRQSQIKDAKSCYAWPASTLNPWKLAAHVMRENLRRGVNLQTRTEARRVSPSSSAPGRWLVETSRGSIQCSKVVHATNAYSAALVPSLRGIIHPCPHICNRVEPPVAFTESVAGGLHNSYGVLLPNGGLFSINPQIPRGGPYLFGGSNPGQAEFGRWLRAHPERSIDDSLQSFGSVSAAVEEFVNTQMVGWDAPKTARYQQGWSGIIAFSADDVPFVGQLPGLPGQWICAGHQGHGMARIFTAAPGLVKLMSGSSWAETKLPECFEITEVRMEKLAGCDTNVVLSKM